MLESAFGERGEAINEGFGIVTEWPDWQLKHSCAGALCTPSSQNAASTPEKVKALATRRITIKTFSRAGLCRI